MSMAVAREKGTENTRKGCDPTDAKVADSRLSFFLRAIEFCFLRSDGVRGLEAYSYSWAVGATSE